MYIDIKTRTAFETDLVPRKEAKYTRQTTYCRGNLSWFYCGAILSVLLPCRINI